MGDSIRGPILLVEDDDVLVSVLTRHLRAHGYEVVVCGTADPRSPACEVAMAIAVRHANGQPPPAPPRRPPPAAAARHR